MPLLLSSAGSAAARVCVGRKENWYARCEHLPIFSQQTQFYSVHNLVVKSNLSPAVDFSVALYYLVYCSV